MFVTKGAEGIRGFRLVLLALAMLLASAVPAHAGEAPIVQESRGTDQTVGLKDAFGIAHISYGNGFFSPTRYKFAQEAGVGWNRWVLYWNEIERSPGRFDYAKQDATVAADRAQGLQVLGVLLGTPEWATGAARVANLPPPQVGQRSYPEAVRLHAARLSAGSTTTVPPQGLELPVFADNTDVPGPGKVINPNNPWARFVYQTASRYKDKVRAWEIWNEPDFTPTANTGWFGFWSGSVESYARLLKVAYLAVKAADPGATVVMGGMAFWFQQDYFPRLLAILKRDPSAAANSYYFDVTAWHWYSRARLLYDQTLWVKELLARNGVSGKSVWITEANLPVCGDTALKEFLRCTAGTHRGTTEHQAAFVLQALAYARAAGVEKVFLFQLYDDTLGPGEYFGLVRNDNTPRPALKALQLAVTFLGDRGLAYRTTSGGGKVELLTLVSEAGQRVRVVWNQGGNPLSVQLPIEGATPRLFDLDTSVQDLGIYLQSLFTLSLPPASLNDSPLAPPDYIVGGRPMVLVETSFRYQLGRIEGVVQDATGLPVRSTQVRVEDKTTLTDIYGRYRFELLPGLYDVSVELASTYPPLVEPALVVPVWSGKVATKNFALRPFYQRFVPLVILRGRPR